jgi:hypothetical protein
MLTDQNEVVANYIYTMLNESANKTALGVVDTWYGDQTLLPHTPALCVAPGNKQRTFQGVPLRIQSTFETYVMVYFAIIQDIQQNLHGATTLADSVELLIHSDIRLGGNVVSCLCVQNEPGMITKSGNLVIGARLTFQSISKTNLPQQVV